jgi:hypothetical protein
MIAHMINALGIRDIAVALADFCTPKERYNLMARVSRVWRGAIAFSATPHAVTIRPDQLLSLMSAPRPHMTGLTIFGHGEYPCPLPTLAGFGVVHLHLEGNKIPMDGPLVLLARLRRIVSLTIRTKDGYYPCPRIDYSQLQRLILRGPKSSYEHLLAGTNELREVDLDTTPEANALSKQTHLTSLRLRHTSTALDNCNFPELRQFTAGRDLTAEQLISFLGNHPLLTDLDLTHFLDMMVTDAVILAIANLQHLRSLTFPIDHDDSIAELDPLLRPPFSNNHHLTQIRPPQQIERPWLQTFIEQHPELTDLDLTHITCPNGDLIPFDLLPKLRSIRLPKDCSRFSDRGLQALIQGCPLLTSLSLPVISNLPDGRLSILKDLPLRTLRMSHRVLPSSLTATPGAFTHLTELSLYRCVGDLGQMIHQLTKLEKLDLNFCPGLNDALLQTISTHCKKLTSLAIQPEGMLTTPFTRSGLMWLNREHLPHLTELQTNLYDGIIVSWVSRYGTHLDTLAWS